MSLNDFETKAGLRVKPPKTKRGKRPIGLTADAVAMLREHRKRQIELRLQLGQGGQPVLVFTPVAGELLSPDNLTLRARKLPLVSFHSLRHTHASVLLNAGVDVLTVRRRLGHRKASTTLDVYGHTIEGADKAATKKLEGLLSG